MSNDGEQSIVDYASGVTRPRHAQGEDGGASIVSFLIGAVALIALGCLGLVFWHRS